MGNIPDIEKILVLETRARKFGSGIYLDDLLGKWKLKQVFTKKKPSIDIFSSAILNFLNAVLEIKKINVENDDLSIQIKNSIKLSLLKIEFQGLAQIVGKQPRLVFYFDQFSIYFLTKLLFNKKLLEIDYSKRPFFALIAVSDSKDWLSARGKGGGLALWLK